MKLGLFPSAAAKFRSGLILLVAFSLIASQANAVCISAFEVEIQVALLDSRSGDAPKGLRRSSSVAGTGPRPPAGKPAQGIPSLPHNAAQQEI